MAASAEMTEAVAGIAIANDLAVRSPEQLGLKYSFRKFARDAAVVTRGRRLFQTLAPATVKALSPILFEFAVKRK